MRSLLRRAWPWTFAAFVAPGCAPERAPGRIDDADDIELCVGEVEIPDEALRAFLLEILPQPEPVDPTGGEPPEQEPVILAEELRRLRGINAPGLGIVDITGLECAQAVTSLGLAENAIEDLGPLLNLTGLTQIELSENNVTDLRVLAQLTRLERVALDENGVTDLGPLAGLTNLRTLDLAGNGVRNVTALAGLEGLEVLVLSRNELVDIAPLAGLTQLFGLELDDNAITSVEALRGLTALEYLDLDGNAITSVEPLEGATKMREIELSRNALTTLQGVEFMLGLTRLVAQENAITSTAGVANLVQLNVLDLGDNEVTELPGVRNLLELRRLVLALNHVTDISAVEGLAELRDLDLRFNDGLSDLSATATLPLLGFFGAGGFGQSQDLSPLAGRTVLRSISFTDAVAGDFSFFASLPAIESVNLTGTPLSAAQLTELGMAPTLQTLTLRDTAITDLFPLIGLPLLKSLDARDCALTDLQPVAAWQDLNTLLLQDNATLSSLVGLETHERLTVVDVSRTAVDDLTPLAANETFRQGDEVVAESTALDAGDCPAIQTIRSRNGVVTSEVSCG